MNTLQVPESRVCRPRSDSEETEYVHPTDLLTSTENWTPEIWLAAAVSTLLVALTAPAPSMSHFPSSSEICFDREACWAFHDAASRDPCRDTRKRAWHRKCAIALESAPLAFDWKLLCQRQRKFVAREMLRARARAFNLRYKQ